MINLSFDKILLFILVFNSLASSGQVVIRGRVSPVKNTRGLAVILRDTYDGATIDERGFFEFETLEKGQLYLDIANPYYIIVSREIEVSEVDIDLIIELGDNYQVIKDVVITRNLLNSLNPSSEVFKEAVDVYTTPGSSGSIAQALSFLPGVQNIRDMDGIFIRGGSGDEAKVYIDGVLVSNYFSSGLPDIGGVDQFSTSLFKSFDFYNGGYSSVYGQALSGVLSLMSSDLIKDSYGTVGVTAGSLSGAYQFLNSDKNLNLGLSGSYSNMTLYKEFIRFNRDFTKYPESFTWSPNVKYKLSNDAMVKYMGRLDKRDMEVLYDDQSTLGIDQSVNFQALSYSRIKTNNKMDLGFNYSNGQKHFYSKSAVRDVDVNSDYFNARFLYNYQLGNSLEIKAGTSFNKVEENRSVGEEKQFYKENLYTVFSEFIVPVFSKFVVIAGLRSEYSSFLSKVNLAPRLNLQYVLNEKVDISFRYGTFFQSPHKDYAIIAEIDAVFSKNSHYITSYQYKYQNRVFKMEGFYMKYDYLPTGIAVADTYVIDGFDGKGYARGIEFFWKESRPLVNLDYWISYSFLDSRRKHLDFPVYMSPDFSSKHNVALVAKKMFLEMRTQISMSYTYNSGRPYYNIVKAETGNSVQESGVTKKIDQLNFSINHLPHLGKKNKKGFPVISFNINNILNTKNVLGYRYSDSGLHSTPILPVSQIFFTLGVFLDFGANREEEILNQL